LSILQAYAILFTCTELDNKNWQGKQYTNPFCFGVPRKSTTMCSSHGLCLQPNQCLCNDGYYETICSVICCFQNVGGTCTHLQPRLWWLQLKSAHALAHYQTAHQYVQVTVLALNSTLVFVMPIRRATTVTFQNALEFSQTILHKFAVAEVHAHNQIHMCAKQTTLVPFAKHLIALA